MATERVKNLSMDEYRPDANAVEQAEKAAKNVRWAFEDYESYEGSVPLDKVEDYIASEKRVTELITQMLIGGHPASFNEDEDVLIISGFGGKGEYSFSFSKLRKALPENLRDQFFKKEVSRYGTNFSNTDDITAAEILGERPRKTRAVGSMVGKLTYEIGTILDSVEELEVERDDAYVKINILKKNVEEVTNRAAEAEASLKAIEDTAKASEEEKNKLIDKTKVLSADKQVLINEKNALINEKKSLTDERESLKKTISQKDQTISQKEQEASNLKKQIEELKKQGEEQKADSERRIAEARKKAEDNKASEKEITDLKNKLNEKERAEENLRSKQKNADDYIDRLKNEKKQLQDKLDASEKAKKDLENKVSKASEQDKERDAYYKNLEAENKRLADLAFNDALTGTKTTAALNELIKGLNVRDYIFGMTDIVGLRIINLQYGKASGDNVLGIVAETLIHTFGADNVFRIMGNRFMIVKSGTDDRDMKNALAGVKGSLDNQSIPFVYGISAGIRCEDMGKVIETCDMGIKMMKGEPAAPADSGNGSRSGYGGLLNESDESEIAVDEDDDGKGYDEDEYDNDDLDDVIANNL